MNTWELYGFWGLEIDMHAMYFSIRTPKLALDQIDSNAFIILALEGNVEFYMSILLISR